MTNRLHNTPYARSLRWTVIAGLALLAGCQAMTERWCEEADYCEVSVDDDAEPLDADLLHYALMVDSMNETGLRAERDRLTASVDSSACTDDHIRLGLVAGREGAGDPLDEHVLEGLDACREQDRQHPARAALAWVLHDAHEQLESTHSRIDELEHALSEQRSHNQDLREQLEALKAIERSIIERGRE